jgi:hypothetical protein
MSLGNVLGATRHLREEKNTVMHWMKRRALLAVPGATRRQLIDKRESHR